MSLTRSASGPGGLTINTGAANAQAPATSQPPAAGGLFGSTTQTQTPGMSSGGGLFGNTGAGAAATAATTQAQPATSLFGSTTTAQPAATGGGLFGSTAAATTQAPATGGLFGASTATTQAPATGGLFGSTTTTTQAPATGGLFGQPAAQPAQTGGLFGSSTATTQAPAATGGLFGQPAAQSAQTGSSLFGASTAAAQPASTSLFGSKPAQPAAAPSGGLFGQSTAQTQAKPSLFGSTTQPSLGLGQSTQQQQQQQQQPIPGARIDLANVKPTTRFNDLHDELQKEIMFIDATISKIMSFKGEIDAFMPQHEADVRAVSSDVALLTKKYEGVRAVLDADVRAVAHLQDLARQDADDARLSFRAVDNLKLPAHYHTTSLWGARNAAGGSGSNATGGTSGSPSNGQAATLDATGQDIMAFYQRHVQALDERYRLVTERLVEVQQHLPGVEAGLHERVRSLSEAGFFPEGHAQQLVAALTDTHQAIVAQANHVAECRQQLVDLQVGLLGRQGGYA